jgi:hypothetical protein
MFHGFDPDDIGFHSSIQGLEMEAQCAFEIGENEEIERLQKIFSAKLNQFGIQ